MHMHMHMHMPCGCTYSEGVGLLTHWFGLHHSPEAESLVVGHSLEELATRGDLHEHVQVLRAVSE